jgi:hypothetical protein
LAARHLDIWTHDSLRECEFERMRATNAEWDFMGRSFLVWSLANMVLRDPAEADARVGVMDRIIDETLRLEKERGVYFFLMPYAKASPYRVQPVRSLFVDSEIALMLAARRLVREKLEYRPLLLERAATMAERMRNSPLRAVESYPDECWTFDHAVALAALRLTDRLEGTTYAEAGHEWLALARERLTDRATGLLVSSFNTRGQPLDGPEGSTIWMAAHCLQVVDPAFARDQYQRARKELGKTLLGFGYAREWPTSWRSPEDVDSGPIIPGLDISAGSSGMAVIGAAAFADRDFLGALAASLEMAAFPRRESGRLRYCASNEVGDAALLYASVLGPLWQKATEP